MAKARTTIKPKNIDQLSTEQLPSEDPKKLFEYVMQAEEKEKHAAEVKRAALRLLRDSMEAKSFKDADGNLYQIRHRKGEPYLARISSHERAVSL